MAEPLEQTLRRIGEEDEAERARSNIVTMTDQNADEAAAERATPARMRDMEILAQSPRLRRYLSSASNAALAHDDLPALSVFERVNDIGVLAMDIYAGGSRSRTGREIAEALDFDGAWEQGQRNIEAARLANRDNPVTASVARDGFRPLDAAGRRRLDVLDATPRRQYGVIGQVIEQLPQIAGSFEAGGRRAVRDVRQSWRQIYGDEPRPLNFQNGVAATVLAPIAGVSATISAVGGAARGVVGFTYEQEAGAAYQEYRRLVDVDGNQLSPEIAGEAARNVGMINAGVEFIGLGGDAWVAGVNEVVQRLSNSAVRGALRRQGYLWATRRLATGVAGVGLSEGFTELTQEGVTIAFGEMARQQQGGEWEDLSPDEVAERAWEAFRTGATVGAVLGSVPAGARFDGDIAAVRDARLQEEVFAALAEGSEGSRLKGRSLGAFADAVNTLTANGPLAEVRIDANRFVSFYQDQEIDAHAAADALKGVGADALDRALETGGEISIPMGTYQAQIVGTPSYDGLTPHIRLGPDKLTPAEVRARLELGVDIERATAEATRMQGEANALRKRVDAVETRIAAQFDEAGFIPQAQRGFVKAYASHIVNMAQRAGVDPETMLDRVGFSLRGPLDARKSDVDAIVDGVIERIESAAADIPRNGFPRDGLGVARPRATAERVSARASDADGTLTTSWGATLNYRAGDMIVGEAQGDARPVRADIFAATYEETAPGEFGKRADAVVGYFVLRAARTIKTLEGPVKAEAGDVVLVGAAGEMWPIKRAKFDDRYQVIGDGQLYQDPPAIHPTALRFGTEEEIAELLDLVSMGADVDEVLAHPIMQRVQAHAETLEQTLPLSERDNPDALNDYDYAVNGRSVGFKTMLKDALRVARSYGEVGTDRVATIVVGNFAAGKSTFIKKLAVGTRAAVVDADQVKSYIPFYEDGYNTGATGAESSAIRWKVRDALMRKGENIVIEHVGDNPASVIKSKTEMEEEGYTVTVVHVKVEAHEATRRATRRFIETGRYIEPNATRRVVEKELVTAAFNSLVAKGEIDAYIEVDATPPPRQAVVLRAKGAKLQTEAIADAVRGVRRDAGLGDEGVQGSRESGSNEEEVNDDWRARLSVAQNEQGDWQVVDQSGERQSDHVFSERAGADLALENMRYGRRELDGAFDQGGPNQGPRGSATFERNAAGVMTSVVMDLFEARNLSTPIHEFGHIFLETLRMVASDEGASAQTKKDWATALEWMGLTDAQWSEYSKLPPQEATNALRVYHEQFARGFEAYVREGKAPSMALRDVFSQFKRWLISIYKSMAELRVELTPQMREVFDRLLASDEAIAEAQAAAGADKPLTREQFGGKGKTADAAYARYVKHFDRARVEAAEEIDKAAIGALMADRTRWWRSRERQVRKAEEINFDSRPEQRAYQMLAFNVWKHGKPPAGLGPIRLSPASLIEDYGQDFISRLPAGLVTPDVDGLVEQARLVRSELNKPAPKRLAEAISDLGGIKLVDAEGRGDIEAIIGTDAAVPVRGGMKRKLLSGTGRTLEGNGDDAGLIMALWEAGYFGAGPDSAGVFQLAGVNAATASMDLLAIARQLEREGKSKGLIWNLTGWSRSPLHNDWQFEIDPDGVTVLENLATAGRAEKVTALGDLLHWPDLYRAYPFLADITVYFQKASPRVTEGGSYMAGAFNGLGAIWVTHPGGPGSSDTMLSVLRHEIQHAIQKHENWPQGYSWDRVRKDSPRWERTWKDRLERQAFWRQAMRGDATPTEADIQEAKDGAAFEIYMLEQGEVEARTVQGRAVSSREARRFNPPGSSMDPEFIARTWSDRPRRWGSFHQDGEAALLAVHNLTGENLLHAVKLGGIPAPSLAIINADIGFTDKFGEITLIARPSLIDPRTGDKARSFNADVYSPRYPTVRHKIIDRAWNKAIKLEAIQAASQDLGNKISSEMDESTLVDKGIGAVVDSTVIQLAWLRMQGETVEIPMRDGYREGEKQADYWAVRSELRDRGVAGNPEFIAWVNEQFAGAFGDSRIFKGYDYNGRARYAPHTLANVVRIMTTKVRNGEGFNYGVGSIRSTVARQFRTLTAIKKARGSIVTQEEMKAIKEEVDAEFWELATRLRAKTRYTERDFGWGDTFSEHLKEVAETNRMSSIFEYYEEPLDNDEQVAIAQFLEKLRDLPTEYFETKMARAVQLNEFSAAVVPVDADARVIEALRAAGVEIRTYAKGDPAARIAAVRDADPAALFQGERPTIDEFKELLRRDLSGDHVYRLEDQERVEALEAATRMRDWFAERGVDIKAKAGELKKQIEAMAASVDDQGVDADLAASLFGFDSGREMLEAIIDAPDRAATIDANTRKAMLDEYGDPFADGSIAEEARLAAHGAARAQVIELELDAMSRATGGAMRPLTRLAKRIAEDQIGRMTVKQIRDYDWFLGNERRHGKEALEALARGNAQEAQMAKHRQLVNHYLYALARKASEETEVAQRYFRKFNSAGVRGNIDGEYLGQIDQLLEQYELRKVTGAEIERRISLTAWVASMEERGLGHMVNVDPAMLENARKIPFAQLQLDDLRGLIDTIRNIEHLGRLKDKLLDAADKRAFRDVVSDLVDTMETTGPISPEIRSNYSPNAVERTQDRMREAHAEMTRMEFLFRYLDGKANGSLWNRLWLPFARAADKESAMMHASAQKMSAIWDRYTPRERARMFKTRIPMTDLPVGAATSYTKAELLAIALNLGNDGNVQALVDGFAWAQQAQQRGAEIDYQAVKDQIIASLNRQLNERDWQTVQQIWDLIGEFRDEAFQLQEDLTGVRPEAVKASPVQTPYGEIAGGYYPLKFDRTRDRRVAKADAAQEVQERWGSNHFKPMTRKGHTINRVGSGGRPVKLSLTVVSEHVQNVVHDISYRRAVIDAERLISDAQFAETFVRIAGLPMYEQLMPWLQAIASDRVDPSAFMWKFLQKLRGNVAIAAMGYRISTGLQQITGLVQAIPMLGSVEMASALVKLVGRPDQISAKARFILNRSEFMRSRVETFDRDVRETIDRMERSDPLHPIRHHAFALVGVFDWGVSSVVWTAAYDKARAGNVVGIQATDEQAAVHYADSAVRTTQSAGLPQDLPAIMRTQQVNKLLTMFFSYFSVLYNWTAYDQVMGARKGRISPVAFMANMALIYVVSPMIAETLAGRLAPREDEDEEERNARLMSVVLRFPFQTVPVLRDIANAVGTGFEYQLSPAQSAPGQIAEAAQDVVAGRTFESEATTKRFVTAIGYAYGLPTPQAWVTVDYFADKLEGEEEGFDPYEAFVRDTR